AQASWPPLRASGGRNLFAPGWDLSSLFCCASLLHKQPGLHPPGSPAAQIRRTLLAGDLAPPRSGLAKSAGVLRRLSAPSRSNSPVSAARRPFLPRSFATESPPGASRLEPLHHAGSSSDVSSNPHPSISKRVRVGGREFVLRPRLQRRKCK